MIIQLVSVSVPSGKRHELAPALSWLAASMLVQEGCLACRLYRAWPEQDEWHIEARWKSMENLHCHLRSDVCKQMLQLMEMSTVTPSLEFFSVLELRGLDLVEAVRMPVD